MTDMSYSKLAILVGKVKRLFDEGKTISEIATILDITEVDARCCKSIIDIAEAIDE